MKKVKPCSPDFCENGLSYLVIGGFSFFILYSFMYFYPEYFNFHFYNLFFK